MSTYKVVSFILVLLFGILIGIYAVLLEHYYFTLRKEVLLATLEGQVVMLKMAEAMALVVVVEEEGMAVVMAMEMSVDMVGAMAMYLAVVV